MIASGTCDAELCSNPASECVGPLHLCAGCASEERAIPRDPMFWALEGLDPASAAEFDQRAGWVSVELLGFDARDNKASRLLTPEELQALIIAALRAGGAR
jgi:hypothetical protein